MELAICIGGFNPLHQGHLDLIMRAKKDHKACLVAVVDRVDDEIQDGLDVTRRAQLVRSFFKDDSHVTVVSIDNYEKSLGKGFANEDWQACVRELLMQVGLTKDEVQFYVGDAIQAQNLERMGLHVTLVEHESDISSAQVRLHPLRYWPQIASTFQPLMTRNILVVGTASEGKTTLVKDVAKYFGIPYAEEWARIYMTERDLLDEELTTEDFVEFLTGQVKLYQEAVNKASRGIMIADTDNLVTLMYALSYVKDDRFGISQEDYDEVLRPLAWSLRNQVRWNHIFVMKPGNDYVDDGFRYMGQSSIDEREDNYHLLMRLLDEFGLVDRVSYLQGGNYLENFNTVKTYINELLAE